MLTVDVAIRYQSADVCHSALPYPASCWPGPVGTVGLLDPILHGRRHGQDSPPSWWEEGCLQSRRGGERKRRERNRPAFTARWTAPGTSEGHASLCRSCS